MRTVAVLPAGLLVGWVCGVVLGEYQVSVATGLVAAVLVPLAVGEAAGLTAGRRWGIAAGVTATLAGGGGVAFGTWLSTGRGLQPWPLGGTVATAAACVWPVAVTLRHRRSAARGSSAELS